MTEKTGIYSARVPREVIEELGGIDKRKAIETLTRWLREGDISEKGGQIVINGGVDTEPKSVDTSVNDCDGCPYMENDLDMSKFDEVCEFKGLDRQKALDKCVQMLWR